MNIELEQWKSNDRARLAQICNQIDRTYLSNRVPNPYTLADADWWLNQVLEREGKTAIYRKIIVDNAIVGNISVEQKGDVRHHDAEIGYYLIPDVSSRGIMTEATRQICAIAFEKLAIIRITGLVYEPNMPSRRVLEKNDFTLEGLMKNAITKDKHTYNLCLYGKLK
ncbi:MAG: GNAT family protein [Aerococcus sp.]|nr:GNAT family protein [Aerococcus sp.]